MRSVRSHDVAFAAALALLAGCGSSTSAAGPDAAADARNDSAADAGRDAAADARSDATLADAGHDATVPDGARPDAGGSALFAVVQAIFTAQCTSCHDANLVPTPVPDRAPVYPMLPLTAGASYGALVGKPAIDACAGTLVKPGDPNASYLYVVVSQDNPCTGRRMPRGGGNIRPPDPLPAPQIEAIRAWIAAGAPP
jgi:hypothetical protein